MARAGHSTSTPTPTPTSSITTRLASSSVTTINQLNHNQSRQVIEQKTLPSFPLSTPTTVETAETAEAAETAEGKSSISLAFLHPSSRFTSSNKTSS